MKTTALQISRLVQSLSVNVPVPRYIMGNFPATLVVGCFPGSAHQNWGSGITCSGPEFGTGIERGLARGLAGIPSYWIGAVEGDALHMAITWCELRAAPVEGYSPFQSSSILDIHLRLCHCPWQGWLVIRIHANCKASVWGRWQSPWDHTEKVLAWLLLAPCYCMFKHPSLKIPLLSIKN